MAFPMPENFAPIATNHWLFLARPVDISDTYQDYLIKHGVLIGAYSFVVPIEHKHSWWFGKYSESPVIYVNSRCQQLNEDNTCKLHNTDEFPSVCRDYPTIHDDLMIVPECGYKIVETLVEDSAQV